MYFFDLWAQVLPDVNIGLVVLDALCICIIHLLLLLFFFLHSPFNRRISGRLHLVSSCTNITVLMGHQTATPHVTEPEGKRPKHQRLLKHQEVIGPLDRRDAGRRGAKLQGRKVKTQKMNQNR